MEDPITDEEAEEVEAFIFDNDEALALVVDTFSDEKKKVFATEMAKYGFTRTMEMIASVDSSLCCLVERALLLAAQTKRLEG